MSGAPGQSAINPVRTVNGRCRQVRPRDVGSVDHLNLFIDADLTPEERPISSAATASASTTGGRSSPGPPPPRTA
jgi:hypothetical protein